MDCGGTGAGPGGTGRDRGGAGRAGRVGWRLSVLDCGPIRGIAPVFKGGATACTRFTSVRPPYYPTALVARTERPRTPSSEWPRRAVSAP
eukprot:2409835-Prymnesium_polylepis.1